MGPFATLDQSVSHWGLPLASCPLLSSGGGREGRRAAKGWGEGEGEKQGQEKQAEGVKGSFALHTLAFTVKTPNGKSQKETWSLPP